MKKYIDADKLIETLIELQEIPTPGLAKVTNEAISLGLSLAVREVRKSPVVDVTGTKFIDKITNYDRIRNMSIDEMVCAIRNQIACGSDFVPCGEICGGECNATDSEACFKKVKQWLESEVE